MAVPKGSPNDALEGFEGAIAGLGLSDVIQLNALNRFSGCLTVQYDLSTGLVFFRDGEIIHAEYEGKVGEEAFYGVMRWPGGRFSLQPNVTTTSHSVKRSWKYLLMEAHRLLDESRSGRAGGPPPAAAPSRASPTLVERIRAIPGVAYALLLSSDGGRVADESYEAETLQGQTAYLTMVGQRLGEIFGSGPVQAAVVQGARQHLLLVATKQHHLSILVRGDHQPGVVEAEVRKLLGAR